MQKLANKKKFRLFKGGIPALCLRISGGQGLLSHRFNPSVVQANAECVVCCHKRPSGLLDRHNNRGASLSSPRFPEADAASRRPRIWTRAGDASVDPLNGCLVWGGRRGLIPGPLLPATFAKTTYGTDKIQEMD